MIPVQKLLRTGVIAACMLGVAGPVHSQEFKHWIANSEGPSKVGAQVKIQRFTATAATSIRAAGFSFVRLGVWVNAMRSSEYQKRVASAFATAQAAGLPVLLTVRSTVPLAQTSSDQAVHEAQLHDAAEQLVRVVSKLVGTYGENMLGIELWNEPDLPVYWPTGRVDTTFPIYMIAVCAGLKAIYASVPVIGFGFATAPATGTQSDKLLQSIHSSSANCIDAVSYHAYGMSAQQIQEASRYIRVQYGLPALITEWGVSSGSKDGVDGQAAKIRSFLMKRDLMKTPLISIYEWQDTANGKNLRERNFGLVDASGAQKPALDAAVTALHSR
ncbi:hypothetical protein HDG34_003129 [Paraburkholderia sp. HC6.4b]|uniref:cellulase family glycosylhydrolase n=1 Tax=unclassified Paraburkholderia TaxID=2615204 RepID=UPI0016179758|nr:MULTISPECIES: cellulase family glycosylhydrolase [unclassified Paraburkholderia]MBB5409188.1 hypothetical protein [Paraburkholderia sp. HC6.4b]MBB5450916.1 hypothetical protein [Paraburkholderia sp. Kb1A]